MKKLTAALLCILCIVSSLTFTTSAANEISGAISSVLGLESDENIGYGIIYDTDKLSSGVSAMYNPRPTVTVTSKGTYTVTDDIPLAIDYEFVCWVDKETGKEYRAGDKYYVNGQKTLHAVWVEKDDSDGKLIRIIDTVLESFFRRVKSIFGVFEVEFVADNTDSYEAYDAIGYFEINRDEKEIMCWAYDPDTRTLEVKVELPTGSDYYESFSRTEKVALGGNVVKKENVEWQEVVTEDGKTEWAPVVTFEYELVDSITYSALYETKGLEDVAKAEDGTRYQTIRVTITDGAPDALGGSYVTLKIARGMLKYKDVGEIAYANAKCFPRGVIRYSEN